VNGLDTRLASEAGLFVLEATRAGGVIAIAPLSWSTAPNQTKAALVLLLAFLAHGIRPPEAPPLEALGASAWIVVVELLVGVSIGFVVRCTIAIAETCGEIISPSLGLGVAHIFDPSTQSSNTLISALLRHLAILLALAAGLHRVVLAGLLASYRLIPVGMVGRPGDLLPLMLELTKLVLEAGLRAALPLVAILFMLQVTLGFIARAAPQMQIFNVGFSVTIGVGVVVLIYVLPDMSYGFLSELSHVGSRLETLIGMLGSDP
jgi:flagellar biosynthesis protein FliR